MQNERQLLVAAHAAWSNHSTLRSRRERFKRYTYGDQWGDLVPDENGHLCREGDILAATGRQPLSNNLIRRLVKMIVGRYRRQARDEGRYKEDFAVDNCLAELDSRLLEEFLISGCAIQRVSGDAAARSGVRVTNVNPRDFFVNAYTDPRGRDIEMVGMLHAMSLPEVLARFGDGDAARHTYLRNLYSGSDVMMPGSATSTSDFFTVPGDASRCRVIEVWTLDAVESEDDGRVSLDFVWQCRWLAPGGQLLHAYSSPWSHGRHPFVVRHYPLTDGEVHPFVEDVIDQQRYINRLIVMIDRMMGSSAKGVLLFPVDQKTKECSWDDVRRRWTASDGIIPITGRSNLLPHQVTGTGNDAGAHKLLELELKLFEDVSGVSDALLGGDTSGNGGSALYESRVANGTIALGDLFETFAALTYERDAKACAIREDRA